MSRNRIILILVAAIALGLGIYVILGGSGNDPAQHASSAATCKATLAKAAGVEEAAQGQMAAFRRLEEPADLNRLTFTTGDGKVTGISAWKGRTVLLNLWATWCVPCREEMPALELLQKEKGSDSFEVVPVSVDLDNDTKPKEFYEEIGLTNLGFFHDGTSDIFFELKKRGIAFGMPTTVLVDTNGCGIGVLNGAANWASNDAFQLIDAAVEAGT